MKGIKGILVSVIFNGITALFAFAQTPTPEGSVKPQVIVAGEYPELGYTSVMLMNADPPAMMPVIMGIRQRIPAK